MRAAYEVVQEHVFDKIDYYMIQENIETKFSPTDLPIKPFNTKSTTTRLTTASESMCDVPNLNWTNRFGDNTQPQQAPSSIWASWAKDFLLTTYKFTPSLNQADSSWWACSPFIAVQRQGIGRCNRGSHLGGAVLGRTCTSHALHGHLTGLMKLGESPSQCPEKSQPKLRYLLRMDSTSSSAMVLLGQPKCRMDGDAGERPVQHYQMGLSTSGTHHWWKSR